MLKALLAILFVGVYYSLTVAVSLKHIVLAFQLLFQLYVIVNLAIAYQHDAAISVKQRLAAIVQADN